MPTLGSQCTHCLSNGPAQTKLPVHILHHRWTWTDYVPSHTVCVRFGVFRHNQDPRPYRHNKTSLLVWTDDDTPVEGKVGTINRLVTNFNEIKYDLKLANRWQLLCFNLICNQIFQQSCEWWEICDITTHMWCPHERYSMISWPMT